MKWSNLLMIMFLILFSSTVLLFTLRGIPGNPTQEALNEPRWKDNGPFELSPERGRFALIYSLVENNSPNFSEHLAQFTSPDVGYLNGKYVSIFAPGVSLLAIPGYLLGKSLGISQVATFAVVSLFAVANIVLIYSIARKLGSITPAALLAGLVFLFATPSFTYAVTLYQHHFTTFAILGCTYLLLSHRDSTFALLTSWLLVALAILIDYPNVFLLFPIMIYLTLNLIKVRKIGNILKTDISFLKLITPLSAAFPIAILLWFNIASYNNPWQIGGTVQTVKALEENTQSQSEKTILNFFKTRNFMTGLHTLLFSSDRGVLVFAPVILLGFLGLPLLIKKGEYAATLLTSLIAGNIVTYSMWGDPWGGWAFGSRYLIPAYAVLAILLALVLTKYHHKLIILLLFFGLAVYSTSVNLLGALTSSKNPPSTEISHLEFISGQPQKLSYDRNIDFLKTGSTKSFVYNTYLRQSLSPQRYYFFLNGLISTTLLSVTIFLFINTVKRGKYEEGI